MKHPAPATPSILGVVVTRDEWPLIGASVAHALVNHVDTVYVIDHASSDGTAAGLAQMQQRWGDALKIYRFDDVPFLQEAMNATIVALSRELPHEWLYIFDADEFMLTPGKPGLRSILGDMPPEIDAVRYELDHYAPPRDFEGDNIARLCEFKLFQREQDAQVQPFETVVADIERGVRLFYSTPFHSKVIVRRRPGVWLAAGAHLARGLDSPREYVGAEAGLRCAHLTYLSPKRLEQKAALGANHLREGFPAHHGWQNQMLARLAIAGELARYWEHHSYEPDGCGAIDSTGAFIRDEDFSVSVATTVEILTRALESSPAIGAPAIDVAPPFPMPAHASLVALRGIIERATTLGDRLFNLESESQRLCESIAEAQSTITDLRSALDKTTRDDRARAEATADLLTEVARLRHELMLAHHDLTRPSVTLRKFMQHLPRALNHRLIEFVKGAHRHRPNGVVPPQSARLSASD